MSFMYKNNTASKCQMSSEELSGRHRAQRGGLCAGDGGATSPSGHCCWDRGSALTDGVMVSTSMHMLVKIPREQCSGGDSIGLLPSTACRSVVGLHSVAQTVEWKPLKRKGKKGKGTAIRIPFHHVWASSIPFSVTSLFLGFASKHSHLPAAQHKGNREALGKLSTRSPKDYLQLGVSLRQGLLPAWHSEELTSVYITHRLPSPCHHPLPGTGML